MVRNYQNMGRNVEQALDNYRNAVRRGATQSERDNLRNNVINQQQRMRQYRLECNSRGASIAADYYETVSP
jgi:methionine aminopeptidase